MRRSNLLLVILIALILGGLFYAFFLNDQKRVSWKRDFRMQKESPYGTKVIAKLLEAKKGEDRFISFKASPLDFFDYPLETDASYIFIGLSFFPDSLESQRLLELAEAGNSIFISAEAFSWYLMEDLYQLSCADFEWDNMVYEESTSVSLNLEDPRIRLPDHFTFDFKTRAGPQNYYWPFFHESVFCEGESRFRPLGISGDSLVSFVQIPYGLGNFYLHTVPLAFTNIQLLEEEGLAYADGVFAYLNQGTIYWDEYHKLPRPERSGQGPTRRLSDQTPLQYILSQPPLAWAWYLLLATVLLYFLLGAKRRQRMIPLLPEKRNTSLEYIQNIGRLYFLQNDHRQLAGQQFKLWLSFVRERYQVSTRHLNDDFIQLLSLRSEAPPQLLKAILQLHRNIESSSFTSENTMIELHRKIESFYQLTNPHSPEGSRPIHP